jgi:exodeoxyribonuclease V alpha subunit
MVQGIYCVSISCFRALLLWMHDMVPTPTPDAAMEGLAGSVERITFHSEETGFCVLRVKVRAHRDLETVVGTAPSITPGEYVECEGWWVTDRTHGLQFKAVQRRRAPPEPLSQQPLRELAPADTSA